VVALLVAGVASFVVVAGRGGDDAGVPTADFESYSLVAAAEQTIAARTVEFDLAVTTELDGIAADVTLSGAVDNESDVMTAAMDLSSVLGLGGSAPVGPDRIEFVLDADAGVVYFGADALGGMVPDSSGWISLDLETLAELGGQSLDDLRGEMFLDPTESARALLDADDVTEVGPETIDDEQTMHYRVTVDVAAAIAATPQAGAELDAAGVELPDSIVYDVWVTEDNELRRAAFELAASGQGVAVSTSVVLDMRTSDEPLAVEIPSDAFDITGLLDF
jgi:hypothetical protein